jgi:hypothetical protein
MPRPQFRVHTLRIGSSLALLTLFVALAPLLEAASTSFWLVATQSEFLKGDADRLSIDSDGRVTLGPAIETVHDVESPAVWRLLADARDTLWAATGNDGKVWTIDRGGKAAVAFDVAELDVHALAPAPSGGVFAGTSPDGKVYRVAADGSSSTFFDPDDKYIWSLAPAPDGGLFVATGEKGRIYKVSADGRGSVFYDPETTHVMTLVADGKGGLLVGTSSPGRVLRVDASGRAFVLLESSHKEIRGIRLAPAGVIYATAAGASGAPEPAPSKSPEPPPPTGTIPTVTTEISVSAIGDTTIVTPATSGAVSEPRGPSGPQKGAVYRINPDGEWSILWESPDDLPYDVLVEPSGSLLVATGAKGKIYRLSGSPTLVTLVSKVDAQQVTSFAEDQKGRLLLATSNPGRILRMTASTASTGTYLSDIKDTATVATWGAIRWRAVTPTGTAVEISTRSGNTRAPDKTWSDWSKPYSTALGSTIESPKARYLQWRAVMKGSSTATPVLTSVAAAYLPRNTRPTVESITVHPPGVVFQRPFPTGEPELAGFDANLTDGRPQSPGGSSLSSPTLGRRAFQKSLQTFVWQARDADNDRLQYDVLYRLEGETTWMALKRGLVDEIYTWDTTSVPDGTYIVKIVASDAPANAPTVALTGERESTTFDVDNTPATITIGERMGQVLQFTVRDTQSAIRSVEYSQNAGRWKLAYPVDGLLDSREERFELPLEAGTAGAVVLRVTDALGNLATAVVGR